MEGVLETQPAMSIRHRPASLDLDLQLAGEVPDGSTVTVDEGDGELKIEVE